MDVCLDLAERLDNRSLRLGNLGGASFKLFKGSHAHIVLITVYRLIALLENTNQAQISLQLNLVILWVLPG